MTQHAWGRGGGLGGLCIEGEPMKSMVRKHIWASETKQSRPIHDHNNFG